MTSFSVEEGVKPEKRGFQPMRKELGEKFGVVFSLTVVVTATELSKRENEVLGKYTPWHEINPFKPKYESRLTRILSHTNTILQPQSITEEIDGTATAPWDATNNIDIQVHPGNTNIAPQQHRDKHFFTHANATHQCFYTNGSLIEGKAGAGIHASVADNTIYQSSYHLGTEAEVFDAELYGILKARELEGSFQVGVRVGYICEGAGAVGGWGH